MEWRLNRNEFNASEESEFVMCLSCGKAYYGDKYIEHFCNECKETKDDIKFKKWINQFENSNGEKIEISKIISYLYRKLER